MVKKVYSIFFLLLIFTAGVKFTVSMHYCGGHLVSSKLSILGNIATCGMENTCQVPVSSTTNLANHCCENRIKIAGTVNPFEEPAFNCNQPPAVEKTIFQAVTTIHIDEPFLVHNRLAVNSPPGCPLKDTSSREFTCSYRI
ncbi:MAG: hypothetical protein U0X39_09630 [Bacteroidales bacterium]